MDSVSDKISFIFDGDFRILIDDIVYFGEKEFLLLEFAVLLKKWVWKIDNGELTNFLYNSIEDDSPILAFRYINRAWEIYSDWRGEEKGPLLSFDRLLMESKKIQKKNLNILMVLS